MRFMLDTNIVSDLVRQPHGRISARIAEVGETRRLHQHHRGGGTAQRGSAWSAETIICPMEVADFSDAPQRPINNIRRRLEGTTLKARKHAFRCSIQAAATACALPRCAVPPPR